ncbi:hypothetical protein [Streptosporangium sp. NPDC049046]
MTAPGADPFRVGPFVTLAPVVAAGMGPLVGTPPAGAGGTVLTATFG